MSMTISWLLTIVDRPIPSVWVDSPSRVLSSLFILVFSPTYIWPCPLMISQWVSFGRSTLPPTSQLHSNTWASIQTFCLICDMFHLSLTPFTLLEIPHRLEIRVFHCIQVGANFNLMSRFYGVELGLKSTS